MNYILPDEGSKISDRPRLDFWQNPINDFVVRFANGNGTDSASTR